MSYEELWNEFIKSNPTYKDSDFGAYDYDDESVNKILSGEKTKEYSLYDSFINCGEPLPIKGDLAVVSNEADEALAIIKIESVKLIPYSSLKGEALKDVKELLDEEKIEPNDEMMIVEETFKVEYKK